MNTITRTELNSAIDAGTVTVVDALPASPYATRHLPAQDVAALTGRYGELLRTLTEVLKRHFHVLNRVALFACAVG